MLFDPDKLERIKRDLAAHIGPVARLLVDRTAKRSTSWKQLYETLAKEVPEGPDRERFLASRSRL
jgi:serine/threonine-protein kinase